MLPTKQPSMTCVAVFCLVLIRRIRQLSPAFACLLLTYSILLVLWILLLSSEVCFLIVELQKVFDSVPYRSLIAKLRQLNISDFLLKWIVDYLTDSSQCVGVEGATSPPLPVLSGALCLASYCL